MSPTKGSRQVECVWVGSTLNRDIFGKRRIQTQTRNSSLSTTRQSQQWPVSFVFTVAQSGASASASASTRLFVATILSTVFGNIKYLSTLNREREKLETGRQLWTEQNWMRNFTWAPLTLPTTWLAGFALELAQVTRAPLFLFLFLFIRWTVFHCCNMLGQRTYWKPKL